MFFNIKTIIFRPKLKKKSTTTKHFFDQNQTKNRPTSKRVLIKTTNILSFGKKILVLVEKMFLVLVEQIHSYPLMSRGELSLRFHHRHIFPF